MEDHVTKPQSTREEPMARSIIGAIRGIPCPPRVRVPLVVAFFSLCLSRAHAEPLFEYARTYAVGTAPGPVAVADVNSDGKKDIIVGNQSSKTVSVLLGEGNCLFGTAKSTSSSKTFGPITATDLDSDGKTDLVFVSSGINVMWGKGDGTFLTPQVGATAKNARAVTVADVDGDGKTDLIVACGNLTEASSSSTHYAGIAVYLNAGSRLFKTPGLYVSATYASSDPIVPEAMAVGDLNNDDYLDVVLLHDLYTPLAIFKGKDDGKFETVVTKETDLDGLQSICLADADGNGKKDVILTYANTTDPAADGYGVAVMFNGGSLNFAAPVCHRAGYGVNWADVADLNGDAKPDIVTTNPGSWDVSVLFNEGAGTFADAVDYLTGAQLDSGNAQGAVALGDLDGDGWADIAATNSAQNAVAVLRNRHKGQFPGAVNLLLEDLPDQAVSADFDADGDLDLAVASHVTNKVYLYRNNGKGSFTAAGSLTVGGFPAPAQALCVSDLNGDGKLDVAVATGGLDAAFQVFINVTGWSFAAGITYQASTSMTMLSRAIAVGDLTGDDNPDLVVTYTSEDSSSSYFAVMEGDGDGAFSRLAAYATGSSPDSVIVFDINGDGDKDVAVGNISGSTHRVSVRLNSGEGALGSPVHLTTGNKGPFSLAAGDVDGDSDLDIVAATTNITVLDNKGKSDGSFESAVLYSVGSTQFAALGDVNLDGYPDILATLTAGGVSVLLNDTEGAFAIASTYGTGFTPVCVCPGDFDRDGRLELAVANSESMTLTILRHAPSPTAASPAWVFY
jgi:hypothetical protein